MKKSIGFALSIFGCLSFAVVIASQARPLKTVFSRADTVEHTLTLNSSNVPNTITSSYQNNVHGNVATSLGNTVDLSFVNAKTLNGGFVQLANHGKIHNFNDTNEQLTGINGIQFTGSGSFTFKPALSGGILPEITPISVSAGGGKVTVPVCDYFEIEAGDSGASITSLSFSYSCNASAFDVKLANGTYTGKGGSPEYTYKLTINNGTATLVSLDKPSNTSLSNGTVTMSSKTSLQVAFSTLTYNFTYNGHSLTYVSKSGSAASSYPTLSLNRVYIVENFESYTASGQGYTNSTTKYQTTGMRSSIYADYYSSGNTGEIGGSGWPVMSSSDNTNYNASKGHNNSKVGIFKFSNGSSMRYISMNELYGVKRTIGKGSTMSFWARGAYTNTSFDTNHAKDTPMKFYAFYGTPLNSSNQSTVRDTYEFTVSAGATWQHFEFSLDANKNYYGFGFFSSQSGGSTQYVPIDDVEIYTASPYAEYLAPHPAGTYNGSVTVKIMKTFTIEAVISVGNRDNSLIGVRIGNAETSPTSYTFNESNNLLTIYTNGTYPDTSYTFGTITGTYDPTNDRITNISCSGSISSAVQNNGSITAVKASTTSASYYSECEGSTTELQSEFKRRYMNGSWQVDNSNSDRIARNTAQFVSGTGALKLRPYSSNAVALNLNSDFTTAKKMKNIHFWVYNPSSSNITLRLFGYKATGLNSNFEAGSVVAVANSWSYLAMGYTEASIYNFQIADFTNSGVYLTFDNIYLF